MKTLWELLKGIAFLGVVTVLGIAASIIIILIVPAIDCLIHGTPFFP